ncbi:MAG: hypothetical protein J6Y65_01200 [Eggerthellaceae bacterium]|nr:hypothetical protein [Eggerthellaceae bacterium]
MAARSNVIHVNMETKQFELYSMEERNLNSLVLDASPYKSKLFDDAFYDAFAASLDRWNERFAFTGSSLVMLLPDRAVATNTFTVPTMRRNMQKSAVDNALEGLFKNKDELRISVSPIQSTKQTSTYLCTAIRNDIIAGLQAQLGQYKPASNIVTYESAAVARAVTALNPRTRNSTFLFMDIQKSCTHLVFIGKGNALASSTLPFGFSVLKSNKIVDDYMLFNHDVAQLAVLNARERARAKALTLMGDEGAMEAGMAIASSRRETQENAEDGKRLLIGFDDHGAPIYADEEQKNVDRANRASVEAGALVGFDDRGLPIYAQSSADDSFEETQSASSGAKIKVLPKKQPRKFPKYMLRPTPETTEQLVYENFRIFMKWALLSFEGNPQFASLCKPPLICVNMPEKLNFLYGMANAEAQENKVKFVSLGLDNQHPGVSRHLEFFGALSAPGFTQYITY